MHDNFTPPNVRMAYEARVKYEYTEATKEELVNQTRRRSRPTQKGTEFTTNVNDRRDSGTRTRYIGRITVVEV